MRTCHCNSCLLGSLINFHSGLRQAAVCLSMQLAVSSNMPRGGYSVQRDKVMCSRYQAGRQGATVTAMILTSKAPAQGVCSWALLCGSRTACKQRQTNQSIRNNLAIFRSPARSLYTCRTKSLRTPAVPARLSRVSDTSEI